jgi:F-type H+-transporting ATPase subunit b
MNKILIIMFSLSSFLFSSDLMNTDFVPRLVNFLIFVSIIYYLIADKIKLALSSRQENIKTSLEKVQKKLQESKKIKESMNLKLEKSEKLAADIVKNAKKDCETISKKYKIQTEVLIENIKKSYKDKTDVKSRLLKIEVTSEILDDFIIQSLGKVSNQDISNTIKKEVA